MDKKEEQQACVLELPSLQSFAESFRSMQLKDEVTMELTIPGQDKPTKLNKFVLANASDLVRDVLFENAVCAWLRVEDASARPVKAVWVAQSTDPATEGAAVQNVLGLCFGQKVSVDSRTAAATTVIMNAIAFRNTQATEQLVEWMKEQATRDMTLGIRMVRQCAMFESLYTKSCGGDVATALAKHVMTRENMRKHWNAAVEDELMELPLAFVGAADFSSPHDKFTVIRRYVSYNKKELSTEDKRQLLLQCELSELGSKDSKLLCRLDVLSSKELDGWLCAVVGTMESKLEQKEKELQASKKESAELKGTIQKMAQFLTVENLCGLLKSQVMMRQLDLKSEQQNAQTSFPFSI